MDNISSISSGDNIFKYLTTLGILMIASSILYPLQKKQDLEMTRNKINGQIEVVDIEINHLEQKVNRLRAAITNTSNSSTIINIALSPDSISSNYGNKEVSEMLGGVLAKSNDIADEINKVEIKNISLNTMVNEVKIIQKHIAQYNRYYNFMLWIGIIFSVSGLSFWLIRTVKSGSA